MKNTFVCLIAIFLFSCSKELAEPEVISAAEKGKPTMVVSEERAYNAGLNFISRNYYENGRLVRWYGGDGPEAGIRELTYNDVENTVTVTITNVDGVPVMGTVYYFDDNNQIIRIEDVSYVLPGGTSFTEFESGLPLRSVTVSPKTANGYTVEETRFHVISKSLREIEVIRKEYSATALVKENSMTYERKGNSPFEFLFYDSNGKLVEHYLYSNSVREAGYNIRIYPDVDLRLLHFAKSELFFGERPSLMGWFSTGMLELAYEEYFENGSSYKRLTTNVVANKENTPVTFDRIYNAGGLSAFLLHYAYQYVELK